MHAFLLSGSLLLAEHHVFQHLVDIQVMCQTYWSVIKMRFAWQCQECCLCGLQRLQLSAGQRRNTVSRMSLNCEPEMVCGLCSKHIFLFSLLCADVAVESLHLWVPRSTKRAENKVQLVIPPFGLFYAGRLHSKNSSLILNFYEARKPINVEEVTVEGEM
jgi:hypothetical protein